MNLLRFSLTRSPSRFLNFSPRSLIHLSHANLRSQTMTPRSYTTPSHPSGKLLFRQLFEKESSTYTYLLADVSHSDKPAVVSFFFLFGFRENMDEVMEIIMVSY